MSIPSRHTPRPRRAATLAAAIALATTMIMAGCALGETDGPEGAVAVDDTTTADASLEAPCVTEGFPCNLAEVDPQIFDHTLELSDQAALLVAENEGDTAEAIALLRADDDVVDVAEASDAVTFRLTGGRPHDG